MPDRPPRRPPPAPTPKKSEAIERSTGRGRPVRTSRMVVGSAPPPRSRRPLVAAVLVGLVVLLVSIRLLAGGPRPSQPDAPRSEAAERFRAAKVLIRQGKWAEAKLELEQLRQDEPDYEVRQIENHLKVVIKELPNQERFATAADAIAKGELGRASAALAQVKTDTQDRALTDAKEALALRIEARRAEALTLLEPPASVSKWEALLGLSDDLLAALPGDRVAAEWKQQAEHAIARSKRGVTKVITAETPWKEAQERFKSGDVTGALSLAKGCAKKHAQCRTMESGLTDLEARSRRLESLSDGELVALFDLDQKLAGGGSSETSKPLRTRLSSRFFLKASQAKTTGNWGKALEYARQALAADPAHPGASALVSEARGISSELFLRAYQLRDTDPSEAVKLFKEVLAMTPPGDEHHVKAKGFVSRLEAR